MLNFRYIAIHYIRYFVVIMFALVLFMVGFDYMDNASSLPASANIVLIYIMYKSFFAIDMLLPLALVFAMIATKLALIRSNALVAMYALGYSKTVVLKPFLVVSTTIVLLFIALHATSFARADEYSNNIRQTQQFLQPTSDLFFTFEDKYVYFGRLYPLQEKAEDVRIFTIKNHSLTEAVVAKSAVYYDHFWHIKQAHLIRKPEQLRLEGNGIEMYEKKDLELLKNFRPKILDQVYEGKVNYTILDALDAINLLESQNINVDRVKSALYKIFIYPLFVPCLIVIIFFFVPISPRFLNVSLFSFGAILGTLLVWGILFTMIELSNNKTISSEVGVVLPILVMFFGALFQWFKHRTRA